MVVNDVNAPVVGVVAPTVPLILIEAVPVKFVTVPDAGVPRAQEVPSVSPLTVVAAAPKAIDVEPTVTPLAAHIGAPAPPDTNT